MKENPVVVTVSGRAGSGKTTVLALIEHAMKSANYDVRVEDGVDHIVTDRVKIVERVLVKETYLRTIPDGEQNRFAPHVVLVEKQLPRE